MKKSLWVVLSGCALATVGTSAHALSLNANASDEAVNVQATQSLLPGFQAGLGYLNTDDSHNTKAYSGQLMFTPYLPGLDVGVGARYQYLNSYYGDGGGVGLGGHVFVDTPIPLVSVGGYGFYTPEGATHGDVEESYEYGVQARANLIANTYGYVGYRYLHTDFDDHSGRTLDSGPIIGVSVGF